MTKMMHEYFHLLQRYEFGVDDDSQTFESPGGQVSVTVVDDGLDEVQVTAMSGDRVRLVLWTALLSGVPVHVLDAVLRSAEPDLAVPDTVEVTRT